MNPGQRHLRCRRFRGGRTSTLWPGIFGLGILGAVLLLIACEDKDPLAPGSPSHLAFVSQPAATAVGDPTLPPVVVAVRDNKGKTVWGWKKDITIDFEGGVAGSTLGGATTLTPVGGTAIFDDLIFEGPGAEVRLIAESGRLDPAVSDLFEVHEVFRSASLASGGEHTCALMEDGSAYCWGANRYGQLGDGTVTDRPFPTPVATGVRFASLTSGGTHTCGLTEDGSAYCWGANSWGKLGTSTTEECDGTPCSTSPVQVSGGMHWTSVSAGDRHTCGLTEDGTAYCWGSNHYGQGGAGLEPELFEPTPVSGNYDFKLISAGYLHTCGLTSDGSAYCWGYNGYGEVGDGTQDRRREPVPVSGDLTFRTLVAGGETCHGHTCAIATDGTPYCWGRNFQGLIPRWKTAPEPLREDPGLMSLDVGWTTTCGFDADGVLYCWGESKYGQGGLGTTDWVTVPTAVGEGPTFASVSLGTYHSCAVTLEGETFCWGRNTSGQLGNGSNSEGWSVPVAVWR